MVRRHWRQMRRLHRLERAALRDTIYAVCGNRLAVQAAFLGAWVPTEAARLALDYGFNTLQLPEIVSFTAMGNQRSRRVMVRIGMQRDFAGDFDHPRIPEGHPLRRHVLYRKPHPHTAPAP